ncbi:MAG: S8 family serine peptidase [Holophagales bacterium]|nr:S8 family serine peptidase [Holophagales bacterium]
MGRPKSWAVVLFVTGLFTSGWARPSEAQGPDWMDRVDPWVLSTAGKNGSTEFLVFLREQASLQAAAAVTTKEEKGELVTSTLRETAARTQAPVLDELKSLGAEFRPYWIANMIWVRGDLEVVRLMAERPEVLRVSANPTVALKKLPPDPQADGEAPSAIEWGITKTGAPSAWALGFKGSGVVIAGQDTGYDWDHPALKAKYRGWNGSTASHDYNWHDSIHSGGGVCGANSAVPCDDDEHGTHTMGTMVGDDGSTNQIGMAPQAKWIGCRNMDQGNGTPATYSECFQWFVAPTNLAGLNPDPTKAPHVINNSWGCPVSEGCTDPLVLKTVVENARAAGIVVVVSAGNAGSSCSSVNDPPAIYDASFSVGATNSSDGIASFSSRGPVTLDGSNRAKPDISAPGVNVRSSIPGGGYASFDGTSMAGPHVAGHVALLLSAMPQWKGQVDLVEERIRHSAVPLTSGENCGGVPGSQIPNNTFGWGRINALASVSMVDLGIEITDSPDPVVVGGQLTYLVRGSNTGVVTATNVNATVTLSPLVSFVSASTGCTHNTGVVTCSFGSIAKGTFPLKSIVVTVNSGGRSRPRAASRAPSTTSTPGTTRSSSRPSRAAVPT